jgi:hypothetical protein
MRRLVASQASGGEAGEKGGGVDKFSWQTETTLPIDRIVDIMWEIF